MKYLDTSKVKNYRGIGFHIVPQGKGVYYYKEENGISHYTDVDYIDSLYKKEVDIPNIKSDILVIGLEIGCIPHWLVNVCPLSNIEVVESNTELVTAIKSMGYLPNKVKIVNYDIFSYTPTKKYDIIITDTWWEDGEETLSEIEVLRLNYNPYLKSNGKFYTPMIPPFSYEKITN